MPNALKVGLPGLLLLIFTAMLLRNLAHLHPLLAIPANPETPNLFPEEIQSHLTMLRGLAALTGVGALFALAAAAWTARPSTSTRTLLNVAGWLLQLLTLGAVLALIAGQWQSVNTPGYFDGRLRAILLLVGIVVMLLPAAALVWVAVRRLIAWAGTTLHWTEQSESGTLQRQYRGVNGTWRLLASLLLGVGALLVPLMVIDTPHPKAETVSTLLDKTVIAQQKPLMLMATVALLAAGASAWFLRRSMGERTAQLDRQHSRMDRVLRRPTAEPATGTADVP